MSLKTDGTHLPHVIVSLHRWSYLDTYCHENLISPTAKIMQHIN